MTEARPMVCYSRGVIDSLVDKLTDMKERYPDVDPLLKDLESLRKDLVNKFAGARATHWQVKVWMKQNRQLVYDIEDWVDDLKQGKTEDVDFQEQIDEFKAKINAARESSTRYGLPDKAATSDADHHDAAPSKKVAVDSRLLSEEKAVLFGISDPKEKLEELLNDMQKNRKVVSIQGMGGLGKTTLARKVYEGLDGRFECHASVTVGGNSSITALMDVFRQVNPEMLAHDTKASLNEQEVIPQLWEFLKDKRYFVFIDDIGNTHDWSVINCALPNNDLGSRILTTTRVQDVAISCFVRPADFIYEMKGLDKGDSRSLLRTTISRCAKTEDRSANFEKNCDDMLNKCCGFPLAIIVTAGLLATKLDDQGPLGKPEESGGMRNVLDICFADLAPPVKACFLYLSTFPENCTIKKDRLIWRWVAERFIPGRDQESMLETGENYFNELIFRKLIQPVFDDYNDDQAVLCTVHPVIHDFISSLSRQEDFHTTAAELISGPFPYGTIRRFSIDCSRQENNEADTLISSAVHLSRMRSLMIFGDAGRVPDLSTFKHLQVLDLEDTKTFDDHQLERIGSLFLLKYLGLGGTNVAKLPQQIMELEHLSTLDVRRTEVRELPAFGDTKLLSLFAPVLTIPRGVGGMEELEELSEVFLGRDGSHANDVAELVNKSRQLRVLGVKFGYLAETELQGMKHFLEEVGKSKLQSLSLDGYPCDLVGLLIHGWDLQKFELRMSDCLPLVPAEMASKTLKALTHLHIQVKVVAEQGLCALGILPKLILLKLFSEEGTQERLSVISEYGFRSLKVFWFRSSYFNGMELQFKEGAMPHLHRLQIEFNARKTKFFYRDFDFGIQHLCRLLQVRAIIFCKHAKDPEVKAAGAAMRNQVSQIPCNPLPVHGDDLPRKEATREAVSSSTSSVDIRISILPESSSPLPIPGRISFVMEDAMVSSSTGAMNSVLTKLATLMGEWYAELTSRDDKQELTVLRDELQVMNALLKQLLHTPDLNRQLEECRNQMRELTYDIEDSIDDLLSADEEGSGSTEKRAMPHDFIDQIQKLNAQVKTAGFIRKKVKMAGPPSMVPRIGKLTFGPRNMPREQWLSEFYYDERVKPYVERDQPSVEMMRKTFAHLSSDMKTCLLYLSSFPANHVIEKDRLIRRWAAEGFLPKRSVESLWETGESYFFELIARKLIEPIYDDPEDVLLPTSCKVGDSVHGFITALSSEENFVKPGQDGVFWRISGNSLIDIEQQAALFKDLSKVRSLTIHSHFGYPSLTHDLSAFKHLRVLDLEDTALLHGEDLRSVGHLSLVRYLGLAGARLTSVPQEIIALEHLETVDLRRTWHLKEVPAFKSRKLVSLIADGMTLQEGMGGMQVLEELATVNVGNDGDRLAKVVNQSKRLRRLGVAFNNPRELSAHWKNGLMDLLGAIGSSSIQSLCLHDRSRYGSSVLFDLLVDCWAQQRPRHLQKLELSIRDVLPEVPRNMSPSLIDLTYLSIWVQRVDTEGLCILGNLPNLLFLSLGPKDLTKRSIISSQHGFRCLRVFRCYCVRCGMGLQLEAGAMPQLRMLRLEFHVKETESKFGGFDFGIQFLNCLVQVHAFVDCDGSTEESVEAVEAAMRDQVFENPNNPKLKIIRL